MEISALFTVLYHIPEGSWKKSIGRGHCARERRQGRFWAAASPDNVVKSRAPCVVSNVSPTGLRLCTRWAHKPVCVGRIQQGMARCVCASPWQWEIYSRQAWGSFSFQNKLVCPGKMARKFLKVSEMELLGLFLAKEN